MPEKTPTRTRMTNQDKVQSLQQADERMAEMRKIENERRDLLEEVREKIKPIIERARVKDEMLAHKFNVHFLALDKFWMDEKSNHKKKSLDLTNGKIGHRVVGSKWDLPKDEILVEMLQENELERFIITLPKPDKASLKKAENAEIQAQLGIKKLPGTDQFFVDLGEDPVKGMVQLAAFIGGAETPA